MSMKKMFALGRLKAGVMNKLEAAYAKHLEELKQKGEILWYAFEGVTLKLAPDCRFTPDFAVMMADGQMEMRDVKGRWMDDAKVKMRLAADKFPFVFRAIFAKPKRDGGGWKEENF